MWFGIKVYCPVVGFTVSVPVVGANVPIVTAYETPVAVPLSLAIRLPVAVTDGVVLITSGFATKAG